jgi:hypothetical protein
MAEEIKHIEKTIADMLKDKQGLPDEINPKDYDLDISKLVGITGTDAYEFMRTYKDRFNVDMAHFSFTHYFYNEGLDVISIIAGLFGKKKIPLSIKKLAIIGKAGQWPRE